MENRISFDPGRAGDLTDRLAAGAEAWGKTAVKDRALLIRRLRGTIAGRVDEISTAISEECGRPVAEVLAQEILPTLESSRYCEKMFPRWLRPRVVRYFRPGFFRKRNVCYWEPFGLVAVIAPSNFPFSLGMMSLVYLLLAGNAVVLKTSEKSNLVAPLVAELLSAAGIPSDVASVVFGGPEAGRWLAQNPAVRKVFFFGPRRSGEEVASICRSTGKPYVLELGGGTTAIVIKDADIDFAARGIVWSACYANGRSCVGTNRVVVEKDVAYEFIQSLERYIADVESAAPENSRVGSFGVSGGEGEDELKGLIEDALARGARLVTGGDPVPVSWERRGSRPILLTDVAASMRVWSEEVSRPLIALRVVDTAESALDELQGELGPLGVSIWSKNVKRARSLVDSLPVVMAWVNDTSFGLPCLPWGGRGRAGSGMLFSEYALHEAAKIRWTSIHPGRYNRARTWWYPYTALKRKIFRFAARKFY